MAKYQDEVSILISARNEATAQLKAAEAEQLALARTQDQQAQAKAAQARELAQVEAEIRDRALRHTGQTLQADLEQNTAHYNARIRAAVNANQLELANRLATLREIREAEIRAADIQARQQAVKGPGGIEGALGTTVQLAKIAAAARAISGLTEALIESRDAGRSAGDTLATVFGRAADRLPIVRDIVAVAQDISELFTGAEAALRQQIYTLEREAEIAERQLLLVQRQREGQREALEAQRQLAKERAVLEAQPQDRELLSLFQAEEARLEEVRKRLADQQKLDADLKRTRASQATIELQKEYDEAKALSLAKFAEFDRQRIEMDKKVQQARLEAVADVDSQITAQRLRARGQNLAAELQDIRHAFDARITAAREANNAELADRLRVLRDIQVAEAETAAARRDELEQIANQRDGLDDEIKALSEDLARARSRNTPSTLPVADQNRFLTGEREKTQEQDRANQSEAQQQIKAMEDQLKELKEMKEALAELVQTIQKSPVIIAGGGL
jgi:DNA repair exonuclease SbcCD ATPase subunit